MTRNLTKKGEATYAKIVEAAFDITMDSGFERATFVNIAKKAGMSPSGINTHFKRKEDIAAELAPIYAKIIKEPLNYSSTEEFYLSWVKAFDNNYQFRCAVLTAGDIIPKLTGVKGLFDSIKGKKEDIERCIYMCVGYSVINN